MKLDNNLKVSLIKNNMIYFLLLTWWFSQSNQRHSKYTKYHIKNNTPIYSLYFGKTSTYLLFWQNMLIKFWRHFQQHWQDISVWSDISVSNFNHYLRIDCFLTYQDLWSCLSIVMCISLWYVFDTIVLHINYHVYSFQIP